MLIEEKKALLAFRRWIEANGGIWLEGMGQHVIEFEEVGEEVGPAPSIGPINHYLPPGVIGSATP